MNTLTLSRRALRHPLSLLSIGLLLLNDHVLKTAMPSWLTGKLSDVAGLFFFPFLLVAGLSLPVAASWRVAPRRVLAAAILITAAWFALSKTSPAVNALTVAALGSLLGQTVQIILDPTDLIALPVLWATWQVWIAIENEPKPRPPGKASLVALGLATLATIATAPCRPASKVERLTIHAGIVYTLASHDYAGTPGLVQSQDGGLSWSISPTSTLPAEVTQSLSRPHPLPVMVCVPADPLTCYRTSGEEKIEHSQDGGRTWHVAWQTPPGRRTYMERLLAFGPRATCKASNEIDPGPYDLVILEQPTGWRLIAAAGNEGILVYTPAGGWQRRAVYSATPTPYATNDWLSILLLLMPEGALAVCLALLSAPALSVMSWRRLLRRAAPTSRQFLRVTYPAMFIFVVMGLWLIASLTTAGQFVSSPRLTESWHFGLYALAMSVFSPFIIGRQWWLWLGLGLGILSWAWTWRRVLARADDRAEAWRHLWPCVLAPLGLVLVVTAPFVVWAWGLLPYYSIAAGIALLGLVGLLRATWRFLRSTLPSHS